MNHILYKPSQNFVGTDTFVFRISGTFNYKQQVYDTDGDDYDIYKVNHSYLDFSHGLNDSELITINVSVINQLDE